MIELCFFSTTGTQRLCVRSPTLKVCAVYALLPDTIVAHVLCDNRRIGHATDRCGMYVYSLIMIVAFSKEALT